jgi:6-phosphogluconolactonase
VSPDAAGAVAACAAHLASCARDVLATRQYVHLGLSGGGTGAQLCRALATQPLDWSRVHLYQVDERVAPDGDPQRNATALLHELVARVTIPLDHVHLMPVTAPDLAVGAAEYAADLRPLDVAHLGLGPDGHTASWPPDQQAARTAPRRVTTTARPFNGTRRMTLTQEGLAEVRHLVWLVCGADKRDALDRALGGDDALPASHAFALRTAQVVFADAAAAPESPVWR